MKIKRIEIKGFKSFCDRTVLDFSSGITAIVGPNGCGKSNAVDAVRWVLGEQSARDLRGRVMEDVIFSGTANEKPVGMAEINIVFLNENGDAPGAYAPFTEIMITRRLYRSGESDYLINHVQCRRRDILEFFMGTGIGRNGYSIVEQGKVESLINMRPEERRVFIEEASGISRYRNQREAALRRMETTHANLLRVSDIEQELTRQINSLRRQARRARRYKEIKQEIRRIELGSLVAQYKAGRRECTRLEEELQKARAEEVSLANELQTEEVRLEEVRLQTLEGDREASLIQQQIYDINTRIKHAENQLNITDHRLKDLKETYGRQENELQEETERLEQERTAAESLRAEASEVENRCLECRKNLEEALLYYEEQKGETARLVDDLDQARIEQTRAEGQRIRCEAEHNTVAGRLKEEQERQGHLAKQIVNIQQETAEATDKLRESTVLVERGRCNKNLLTERHEQSKSLLADVISRFSALSVKLDSARQELSGKSSRLQSLKELEDRYEWYDKGVREIMRQWKSAKHGNVLHALVAEIFHTEPQFEIAVEAALGQMLQFVIIHDQHEGVEAIEHLKSMGAGRAGFVLRHPVLVVKEQAAPSVTGKGVLGYLMDRVRVADPYQSVGRALLGDFLLVHDLPAALDLWEKEGQDRPIVTLDGDVLTPKGTIMGGKSNEKGGGILYRKRQIRELSHEVKRLGSDCEKFQQDLNVLRQQREETLNTVENCREELQREDVLLAGAAMEQAACEEILRKLTDRQRSLKKEKENSGTLIDRLTARIDGLAGQVKETTDRLADLNTRVEKLAAIVQERRHRDENLGSEVTSLKVECTTLEQHSKHLQENLLRMEALQDDGNRKVRRLEEAQKKILDELAESGETRGRLECEKESLVNQQLAIQKELEARSEQCRRDSQELKQREDTCRHLRKELSDLTTQRASHLNLEVSRVQINLRHLEERAEERHMVVLSQIAEDFNLDGFDPEEGRARLEQLRHDLERLGEVNLMADSELKELQQRYSHLSEQRADLLEAMADLEKTITRMDKETRQRFMETFLETQKQFGEIVPVLFEGGRGELILTGEGDPLESGVDLVVQPPGKKLQSISLLSGGEKALTAIALLFALFMVRRSPLCLMDEVDAPLDDANVERFIALLKKYSTKSQFILVTHNKRTMAIADTLYGITMEEPGISRLVSVRLNGGAGSNSNIKQQQGRGIYGEDKVRVSAAST